MSRGMSVLTGQTFQYVQFLHASPKHVHSKDHFWGDKRVRFPTSKQRTPCHSRIQIGFTDYQPYNMLPDASCSLKLFLSNSFNHNLPPWLPWPAAASASVGPSETCAMRSSDSCAPCEVNQPRSCCTDLGRLGQCLGSGMKI